MTAGENIKKGAEGMKNVTEKVVDAVEEKINQVTDTVEDALKKAGDKIHTAAGQDEPGDR